MKNESEYYEEFDEDEFTKNANQLDLPESDSDDEQAEKDLKGGDTDSELEEYYKELGIEDEVDYSKKEKKTKEEKLYKKTKKERKQSKDSQGEQ